MTTSRCIYFCVLSMFFLASRCCLFSPGSFDAKQKRLVWEPKLILKEETAVKNYLFASHADQSVFSSKSFVQNQTAVFSKNMLLTSVNIHVSLSPYMGHYIDPPKLCGSNAC